jgi:hypothetical protein
LAAFCAKSAEILRAKTPTEDSRFPEGIRDVEVIQILNNYFKNDYLGAGSVLRVRTLFIFTIFETVIFKVDLKTPIVCHQIFYLVNI